jgi:sec-independent protein translocase protein TatA
MNEWVIVAIVAVAVIFGASKLPQLARNVGKAQSEFKKGLKEGGADEEPATPTSPPAAASPTPAEPAAPAPERAPDAAAEQSKPADQNP